jgi:hypothetical protein
MCTALIVPEFNLEGPLCKCGNRDWFIRETSVSCSNCEATHSSDHGSCIVAGTCSRENGRHSPPRAVVKLRPARKQA